MAETHKTVLITGAASGIGAATARRFAKAGWTVGVADIDAVRAKALACEIAGEAGAPRAFALTLDVADPVSWQAAVAAFAQTTAGRMDVLFNNAGIVAEGALAEVPLERIRAMLDTNLMGAILGVRACLPLLQATPGARIVNTASIAGIAALPTAAVYSATKSAILGLSRALAAELAPKGVGVTAVVPGFIDTPLVEGANGRNRRPIQEQLVAAGLKLYSPDTVAKAVLRAVERGAPEIAAGGQARWIRFLSLTAPWLLSALWRRGARRWMDEYGG
jgi:NAD(P)-dependent dehydrogenase (short-subunit alcohol dehydrogenase family)